MEKITVSQFFVMLFLSRLFTFFTVIPGISRQTGGTAVLVSTLVFAAFALFVMLPVFFILRKRQGQGIIEYAYQKSDAAGIVCATFFALLSLAAVVDNVVHFEMFITTAVYPDERSGLFIVLFTLTVMYLVWMGLESFARLSGALLLGLLFSFVVIAVSLTREFSTVALVSPFMQGTGEILRGGAATLNETGELFLILLFIPYLKGNVKKGFLWWLIALVAALEALMLITLCTVGDYAVTQTYPLYAVAKMARLFYFQRMDALHMVVWTMVGLVKTALYFYICRQCFYYVLPQRAQRYVSPVCGGLAIVLALILSHYFGMFEAAYSISISGVPLLAAVVALPLLLLFIPKKKPQKEEK